MFFHVCNSHFIYREDTVLSSSLNCHVCDCKTVIHSQILDSLTDKFHRFVECSVHTDFSNDMKDYIFAAHPFGWFADNVEFDGRRYFKPCFSGCHSSRHIGTSHTCGECTECAVSTGMRVCTDDYISGNSQSFFRKERMLDTHLSYIKIISDVMLARKLSYTFAVLCRLNIFIRNKVIHNKCDLVFVKHFILCHFIHFMNGNGRCDIISQYQIQIRLD